MEDVDIVNNTVYENYGEGIGLSTVNNGTVANNRVHDSFSVEVYLDNASDSTVEQNFIYNTGDNRFFKDDKHPAIGIGLANEIYPTENADKYYLNNNLIQNNVVANTGVGLSYGTHAGIHNGGGQSFKGLRNTTIANNTFYSPKYEVVKIAEDTATENVEIENNLFYKKTEWGLNGIESAQGLSFGHNLWYGGDPGIAASSTDLPSQDRV